MNLELNYFFYFIIFLKEIKWKWSEGEIWQRRRTDSDLRIETQALSCKVIKIIIIYKNQFTNFVRDLCDGEDRERESMFVLKLF